MRVPLFASVSFGAIAFAALSAGRIPSQKPPLTLDVVVDEPDTFLPQLPRVQWIADTDRYSEVLDGKSGPYVVARDPAAEAREHRFASADLARALRAAGAADATDADLPAFTWLDDQRVRVARPEAVYHWTIGTETAARRLHVFADASNLTFAKGDVIAAMTRDGDLWVTKPDGSTRRISFDGAPGDVEYGTAAHRAEFGIQTGLFFDPTGRRLAFTREDLRPIEPYPYLDYSTSPPRSRHGRYPMAGRAGSRVSVGVYDRDDDSVRFLENDGSDQYWTNVTFTPDGSAVFVVLVDRGQTRAELVRFDARTGARGPTLLTEQDAQWVEPELGPVFVPNAEGQFLWFSPRDGNRHLYRYGSDGCLLAQVTKGAFDIAQLIGMSADGRTAFVEGSGQDPRQRHLWAAATDGSGMRQLTQGAGTHMATANARGTRFLLHHSALDLPGELSVIDADGALLRKIATATTRLDDFARPRQTFFEVARDDGTVLHGLLTLPPDFAASKRYPLLLYVYGGPHSQLATDAWQMFGPRPLWLAWLASQGCVVATVDGRGTQNRGIEFEQAIHRRLGQLEVEDQLAAVRQLRGLPFVDSRRIGVHGWSYGGYMTLMLMLRAPELFACGISGAPVTTWDQYETGYTERYLDSPAENPEGYAAASALPLLGKLAGRLLLIHGSDDHTVMLSHAVAFLDAAVEASAMVDHMLYPMQQHGLTGSDRRHLYRLMARYVTDHLLGH